MPTSCCAQGASRRQELLQAAGHDQPGQRGRQGRAAEHGDAQQPVERRRPRRTWRRPTSPSRRTARRAGSRRRGRRRTPAPAPGRRRRPPGPAGPGTPIKFASLSSKIVAFGPIIGDPCRNHPQGEPVTRRPAPPPMNQLDQEIPKLVGPVLRAHERVGQALHRQRVLRQAPVAGRHRRIAGPRRDAGRAGHHRAPPTCRRSRRAWPQIAQEIESGPVRMEAGPGGRAPEHRGAPDPAGRRRRQAPAHRPQPQRPGRHRRAPVAARRDRPDPAACWPTCRGRWWTLAEQQRRSDPARLHPPAGGAAGELRPPHAGLCGDVQPRRRAPGRRAPARQPAAAGRGGAGRHQLPAGPRTRGARAGHGRRSARTRWTP